MNFEALSLLILHVPLYVHKSVDAITSQYSFKILTLVNCNESTEFINFKLITYNYMLNKDLFIAGSICPETKHAF